MACKFHLLFEIAHDTPVDLVAKIFNCGIILAKDDGLIIVRNLALRLCVSVHPGKREKR